MKSHKALTHQRAAAGKELLTASAVRGRPVTAIIVTFLSKAPQTRCIRVTMPLGQITPSGIQVLLSSKLGEKWGMETLSFIEMKCYCWLPSLLYSYL